MKGIAGYLIGALALAMLGGACLAASRLDRQMVDVQQALLTGDYRAADTRLQNMERYYGYLSRVPWVGDRPLNDLRARRAAIKYWQRRYPDLAAVDRSDPVADVASGNVPLQLIVADAVYRNGQIRAKDRAAMLQALEWSIEAYRTVLGNARTAADDASADVAARNYEYVARLRSEMLNGKLRAIPAPGDDRTYGSGGKAEDPAFLDEFNKYVPLEKEERDNAEPGKMAPPVRKG